MHLNTSTSYCRQPNTGEISSAVRTIFNVSNFLLHALNWRRETYALRDGEISYPLPQIAKANVSQPLYKVTAVCSRELKQHFRHLQWEAYQTHFRNLTTAPPGDPELRDTDCSSTRLSVSIETHPESWRNPRLSRQPRLDAYRRVSHTHVASCPEVASQPATKHNPVRSSTLRSPARARRSESKRETSTMQCMVDPARQRSSSSQEALTFPRRGMAWRTSTAQKRPLTSAATSERSSQSGPVTLNMEVASRTPPSKSDTAILIFVFFARRLIALNTNTGS